MKLDELLSRPLPYEITENNDTMFRAKFKAGERVIEFFGENDQGDLDEDEGEWDIGFGERVKRTFGDITYDLLTFELTKSGEEFSVFATLKALIEKLVKEKNPKRLRFTADKRDGNRARLYQRCSRRTFLLAGRSIVMRVQSMKAHYSRSSRKLLTNHFLMR